MPRRFVTLVLIVLLLSSALIALAQAATGTLEFYANGEDFVRQGFVSKDGWAISFDHVYVNLTGITAYQSDPPYEPADEDAELVFDVEAILEGSYLVDLAEGDEDADPLLVGEVDAPEGFYNALSWEMVPVEDEESDMDGYTLLIIGTAEKDGEVIDFTLGIEQSYTYTCGEYVGDERKGILEADDYADLEMTFHFDHVFGDGELPPDDGLNETAPGFAPFAALAEDGVLVTDLAALEEQLSEDDWTLLVDILPTLGHVGEGHCHATLLDDVGETAE
ncbi:MAG: DUF4382 domain-containing protein [Chloroflexi bacterium]|nr:DUF4382 domain-containing protein [Chloroflexota bacterium]